MSFLHLSISSLGAVVADDPEVLSLRAEDASGSFGILPGHADFLTLLTVGVLSWRNRHETVYCALRGGVLSISHGIQLSVASREAIIDRDLSRLESSVLQQLRAHEEAERRARFSGTHLEARLVREMLRYLRPSPSGA